MKKPSVWIGIAFAAAVVGVLIYSSLGLRRHSVEVCMAYGGREACRTAGAATPEQALRAASDNACALIARGMTESMACTSQQPVRVTWKDGGPR
jgi:hypothetical protein